MRFQQSVTPDQVGAMCRRALGSNVHVASAVELGNGMYNNTYRVDIDCLGGRLCEDVDSVE